MNSDKYLTVGALTRYIKHKIDGDDHLKCVFLKGEISNFKGHTSGHLYFSIKDETSKINAIMFSREAIHLKFIPTDGTKVLIMGRVSVYEATGNYQIYVEEMLEDGVGNLYIAFEKLKKELGEQGLFDEIHKKPIPKYPKRIGIVTAPTGAAIRDILSTIRRRYPICETYLFGSLVQGSNAASDIANKIKLASTFEIDILIVGRGGGSIEDLWPFNEEIVARAIYESSVPIISAVGHEVDFTIADFVADLRAPTPTGAAEMAVPNLMDVTHYIKQLSIRLNEAIYKKVNYSRLYLDSIKNSYVLKTPMIMYENRKQYLGLLMEKVVTLINNKIIFEKNKLSNDIEKLELMNPLKVLKRGYSVVYQDDNIISDVKKIDKSKEMHVKLSNGIVITNIVKVRKD